MENNASLTKSNASAIILRHPTLRDVNDILKAVSKEVTLYNTLPWPYTKGHAIKFLKEVARRRRAKAKQSYDFCVFHKQEKRAIGMASISKIDYKNRNAEVGLWVAKDFWGKGIGTVVLKKLISFGFKKLKLHRLWAKVVPENRRSVRLLKKVGFKYEGRERQAFYKNGKWFDLEIYGLLREESEDVLSQKLLLFDFYYNK